MRTWHRWLAALFGLVLLWVAVTGAISQAIPLYFRLTLSDSGRAAIVARIAAETPKGFVCPQTMTCLVKPPKALEFFDLLHKLHSGEAFGIWGSAVGTLAGFAMIFFCLSGMWMYVAMWRARSGRGTKPRWFWK